jgi:hypothetical protein
MKYNTTFFDVLIDIFNAFKQKLNISDFYMTVILLEHANTHGGYYDENNELQIPIAMPENLLIRLFEDKLKSMTRPAKFLYDLFERETQD